MATAITSVSSPPWIHRTSSLDTSSKSSSFRVTCAGEFHSSDLKFVLHRALDSSGININHAREARKGFMTQVEKLTQIERETSICINRVDLAKTALFIAAEDDSLVSHSSVALPVDSFVDRLYDLSMNFCTEFSSSLVSSSPEQFLDNLERFLYERKGFRRINGGSQLDTRALYLHSVLTHRTGSAALLALIYSEMVKLLQMWSFLDFDCEIFFPHDRFGLPKGYHKQKSVESDHPHIMTTQTLLEEILRNLKETFWPFQHDYSKSAFLRAADAANCMESSIAQESGFQLASAKAAQHRLDRGVWTSVRFGDMRRALAACERLIILESDPKELRDYSILLYHCGFYERSLQYLKLYQERKSSSENQSTDKFINLEEDAVEKLMTRLNLISMEEGWSKPSHVRNFLGNNSEPW